MLRDVLLATLLCMPLLAGAVQGAAIVEEEPRQTAPAFAPVQLVIDAVPDVVRLAIAEARHDLTPDDADALTDRLSAFASGLDRPGRHEPGTVAEQEQAAATYPFAVEVADVAQSVPEAIADVERAASACRHWSGNATVADARRWEQWLLRGGAGLARSHAALTALAADTPPPLDPRPLEEAAALQHAWREASFSDVESCVVVLLDSLALAPSAPPAAEAGFAMATVDDVRLWARLSPSEAWPTQRVVVEGRVDGLDGDVAVRSGRLGWTGGAALTDGAFHVAFVVPREAAMGAHAVQVAVGSAALTLELQVVPAPTTLQLRAPLRVHVGSTFSVSALLETPAPTLVLPGATARMEGALTGDLAVDGTPRSFVAPEAPGELRGTSFFKGTDRLLPAQATYRIEVVALPAETPGQETARRGGGPADPGLAEGAWLWGILLTLVVLAAVAGIVWRRRQATGAPLQGPETWVARTPVATTGPPTWIQTTLLQTMAALHRRLTRMGLLRPRDSVRDMARRAKGWGWDLDAAATRFESVRYGGRQEAPGEGGRFARWLQRRMRKEGA